MNTKRYDIELIVFLLIVELNICFTHSGWSQNLFEDIIDTKYLSPELGTWAIYEITDNSTQTHVLLRQAITDTEKINEKTEGYWLENEIIPTTGFPSIYRILISFDEKGKETIHKIIIREGASPPESIPVESINTQEAQRNKIKNKKLIDEEEVEYKTGKVKAKHYKIEDSHQEKEIWLNDTIKPFGIVKMTTNQGEMILIKHGKGGEESKSAMSNRRDDSKTKPTIDITTGESPNHKLKNKE